MKKLVRPKKDRILLGVAAGLANYLDVDPTIIRIIFVLLTIWGGIGLILYIAGIFIIPEEDGSGNIISQTDVERLKSKTKSTAEEIRTTAKKTTSDNRGELILGITILALGIILLLNLLVPWFNLNQLWPIILIIIGVALLINTARKKR